MFEHIMIIALILVVAVFAFLIHIITQKHLEEIVSLKDRQMRSIERKDADHAAELNELRLENQKLEDSIRLKEVEYDSKIKLLELRNEYLEIVLDHFQKQSPNIEDSETDEAFEEEAFDCSIEDGNDEDDEADSLIIKDLANLIDYYMARCMIAPPSRINLELAEQILEEYENASDEVKRYITTSVEDLKTYIEKCKTDDMSEE